MDIAQNPTKSNPYQLELCFVYCATKISSPLYCVSQSRARAEHKASFRCRTLSFAPLKNPLESQKTVSQFQLPTVSAGIVYLLYQFSERTISHSLS